MNAALRENPKDGPFKCQIEPCDPYAAPDESAFTVNYYPHPSNHRVSVASVTFKGEEMGLRAKRNAAGGNVDF